MVFETLYSMNVGLGLRLGLVFVVSLRVHLLLLAMHTNGIYSATDSFFTMCSKPHFKVHYLLCGCCALRSVSHCINHPVCMQAHGKYCHAILNNARYLNIGFKGKGKVLANHIPKEHMLSSLYKAVSLEMDKPFMHTQSVQCQAYHYLSNLYRYHINTAW